ncbi:MAG: DUF4922 domain-containing protein, partial [Bacteroidales bacterium]|nr:DUF4922 domain-containing protein [Bacteroidales bacterium]
MAPLQLENFIRRQLDLWPRIGQRIQELEAVSAKQLSVNGSFVAVQYNPAREWSAAAQVDKVSVSKRPCFLCATNRPQQQINITRGNYQLLVNPYPILPQHLIIADSRHLPQAIAGRIGDMLAWAQELEGFLIFYNGPQSGASAPDHFHFQAVAAGHTPLERVMNEQPNNTIHSLTGFSGRYYIVSDAKEKPVCEAFGHIYREIGATSGEEPMMNVYCRYLCGTWTLIVIPRRRHRPERYFADDDSNMLISPGGLDMAGILV